MDDGIVYISRLHNLFYITKIREQFKHEIVGLAPNQNGQSGSCARTASWEDAKYFVQPSFDRRRINVAWFIHHSRFSRSGSRNNKTFQFSLRWLW